MPLLPLLDLSLTLGTPYMHLSFAFLYYFYNDRDTILDFSTGEGILCMKN
jgi:hypothetical protein